MRVGIYVNVARGDRPTGIGVHVIQLLRAIAAQDTENEYLLYYPDKLVGHLGSFPYIPDQSNFTSRPVRFPSKWEGKRPRLWWNHVLPRVLRSDGIDIFHGPNHFLPSFDRSRNVVTIHDLAYFHMQVHGGGLDEALQEWTLNALNHAGAVIALSENTKADIEKLGVESERIHVIYGGGNIVPEEKIQYSRIKEMRRELNLPEQFFLSVGALQPRKNFPFLLRAYAALLQKCDVKPHLVLAGPEGSAVEEIRSISRELGISDRLHLTGYLDDWQIPLLYKEAEAFVLPTRYEGFTLVTLESMSYGTPLIATNCSSILEGVGNAGELVDVDDVEALSAAMYQVLNDQTRRDELIELGKKQSQKFTWDNCASQTIALYESLHRLNQNKPDRHELVAAR